MMHVGCQVDGITHVARLASFIRTWEQVEQVTDMWLADVLADEDEDEEWRLVEERVGDVGGEDGQTIHFSMTQGGGRRKVDLVLVRLDA